MKTVTIPTKEADFDGYFNVDFVDEERNTVGHFEKIDVWKEFTDINNSLNDDEQEGTPFLHGIRRYILGKYGIQVSIWAAQDYYGVLQEMLNSSKNFFTDLQSSPDSTDSIPEDSPTES